MNAAEYTTSVEDYLKAIYDLARTDGAAAVSAIADRLGVARPSVSGMARRLTEQGLVSHEPYAGLRLTTSGRRVALRLIRRHRVIETYLVRVLGYTWDQVHEEAERLEHAASDELVRRMASALGEPTVDPHGAPIPTEEGAVTEPEYRSVADLSVDEQAVVARVDDEDPALLRYLASLELVPGARIRCVTREPHGGTIAVDVGGTTHHLGAPVATRILIEPGAA